MTYLEIIWARFCVDPLLQALAGSCALFLFAMLLLSAGKHTPSD